MSPFSSQRPKGRWLACFVAAAGLAAGTARAGTLSVLHSFTGGADGATPYAGVTSDAAGNIYGETYYGADVCPPSSQNLKSGCGTVYRIPVGGLLQTLTTFTGSHNGADGFATPTLSGEKLYGSTYLGGLGGNRGVLFLTLIGGGAGFRILHKFDGTDGANPKSSLRLDASGDIFGVTDTGGTGYNKKRPGSGNGILFEVKPDGTYIQQHDFGGGQDGAEPGSIFLDSAGTIYGTTATGGFCSTSGYGCGLIYSFVPASGIFTVLYTFADGTDGHEPQLGGLDKDGNLYGASETYGPSTYGTLFKLTKTSNGFQFATIYTFTGSSDGAYPEPPYVAPDGTLTGTTFYGPVTQSTSGEGILYRYAGKHLTTLYTFVNDANGGYPEGTPIVSKDGLITGTTAYGGVMPCNTSGGTMISSLGCGVVYQYAP